MSDLRILFSPDTSGGTAGYRAQLADAKGRHLGVEVPFTPFLTEDDYEDLRWYLEDYMDLPDGGTVVRAARIERDLEGVSAPFPALAGFLRKLAAGEVPAVPGGLPEELGGWLEGLVVEIRRARAGGGG